MEEMLEGQMSEEIAAENSVEYQENVDTGDENTDDDYAALIENDLEILRNAIPGLEGLRDISELENPVRYGALRDLGLSPEEAFRATTTSQRRPKTDNRSHLRSSAPRAVHSPESNISYRELAIAREIFSGVSDTEIQRLYKKVTR